MNALTRLFARLARLLLATAPLALLASHADAATDRVKTLGGEVRLLVGGVYNGRIEAGLQIRLQPGWKTYWRYPGDSGIPPVIDAGASDNVASVRLLFPAPVRFADGAGVSVGYTESVVLPIEATLADPKKPGRLRLHVLLGVCREICVPVDADLEAAVDPAKAADLRAGAAIGTARLRVPLPAETDTALAIRAVEPDGESEAAIRVAVRLLHPVKPFDLFVEGPDGWALPLPELASRAGLDAVFRLVLEGLPAGASPKGALLRITLVNGDRAVERNLTLE